MSNRDSDHREDDLQSVILEQRRELMAAQALDSDLDFAFHLQLQEALAASLALQPSTSTSTASILEPPHTTTENDGVSSFAVLQSDELAKLVQEVKDREASELEMRRVREDLNRRIHDEKFAREILRIPEDDWKEWGGNYEKPLLGEGCSKSKPVADNNNDAVFRIYTKGLVSVEEIRGVKTALAGIGVAICDPSDNVIFEVRKPLVGNGMSKNAAEAKALIDGLNAAIALELKRVTVYFDYNPLYQFVSGRWPPKQRKIAVLVNQVTLLRKKFMYFNPKLVARNDVKFAFKLAKDAIVSQVTRPAESSHGNNLNEACVICLEDADVSRMFSVDGCLHRYCFSCMKQHVEVKLLHGMVPKCPHEGCKSELVVDSCRKFLPPKSIETMSQRIKEASIPVADKVYCPNPSNMTCFAFKSLNPHPPAEDLKLKSLATRNLWRQCVKCNHMIELAEGCYHMTCRCGYEFCYNCGAEWKNKRAMCSCPLWDEDHIWLEQDRDFDEDEEDEDEDDEYYDSDSDYY
ncbi:hypothetical protein ACB094_08G030000 [Castanea mollissima]